MSINLAIVGSRNFNDYKLFCKHVDNWIKENGVPDELVSGGAYGADSLCQKYADEFLIPIKVFPAQWNKYGKGAGPLRNTLIVEHATRMLAFPSRKGSGTQDSIRKAKEKNINVKVIYSD